MRRPKLVIDIESGGAGIRPEGITADFLATYVAQLKKAYQHCAQQVMTGASEGRMPARVHELDVVFRHVEAASFHAVAVPFDSGVTPDPKWFDLGEKALDRLVEHLDSLGQKADAAVPSSVRGLVHLIPGAQTQEFVLYDDDTVRRKISLRSATPEPVEVEPVTARITRHLCTIKGVSFRPHAIVQLHRGSAGLLKCLANDKMLDKAWQMKQEASLVAVVVTKSDGTARLIGLRTLAEDQARQPGEVPVEETLNRAAGVLKLLADHDAGK